MRPGDHPEFFRLPPPDGRSRESTIVLDRRGRWFHDGELVTHPGLSAALPMWIARHPDDGRLILNNGYDWCYFRVEGTPFFVIALSLGDLPMLRLSDGSAEPLAPQSLRVDAEGVLTCSVKGGAFAARFDRHAQLAIEPLIRDGEPPVLELGGSRYPLVRALP